MHRPPCIIPSRALHRRPIATTAASHSWSLGLSMNQNPLPAPPTTAYPHHEPGHVHFSLLSSNISTPGKHVRSPPATELSPADSFFTTHLPQPYVNAAAPAFERDTPPSEGRVMSTLAAPSYVFNTTGPSRSDSLCTRPNPRRSSPAIPESEVRLEGLHVLEFWPIPLLVSGGPIMHTQ
jgi:hypothetical protein